MDRIVIDEIDDIVELMLDTDAYGEDINVVGDYYDIRDILNTLIAYAGAVFVSGELIDPEFDEYEDAYYLNYADGEIIVGKMYNDIHKKYIYLEPSHTFLNGAFVKKFLETNPGENVTIYSYEEFENEDEFVTEDGHNHECVCAKDDGHGFAVCAHRDGDVFKLEFHTTEKLTDEDIKYLATDFLNNYVDL